MTTDEYVALLTRRTYVVDNEDLVVRQHASCYEIYVPGAEEVIVIERPSAE